MDNIIKKQDIIIYIIDDDEDIRVNTGDLLSTQFDNIKLYSSPNDIIHKITPDFPAVILTDLRMPNADGFEFAQSVYKIDAELPVILMTGYGDISLAVDAIKHGVYDFMEKPFDTRRLIDCIHRAVDKRYLTLSLRTTKKLLEDQANIESLIVGQCPSVKRLKRDIVELAPMDIPILIYGETGVGKELVARCLHEYSTRCNKNFVPLNCAAIPEQLAEAELFGYKKGAFTDAQNDRIGKLEYAQGGTLFLDEIESLPLSTQAKLLRALSDNIITPIGSNQEISIDCRVVSATKDELRDNKDFRQDLFFRLQVGELYIPALRQRGEDIINLFEYFAIENCEKFGTRYQISNNHTRKQLMNYEWPGNVRELINIATRYALKGCGDIDYAMKSTESNTILDDSEKSLKQQVDSYEELLIRLKLKEHEGKVSRILSDLKIERRTFNQKLNRYGISTAEYKKR